MLFRLRRSRTAWWLLVFLVALTTGIYVMSAVRSATVQAAKFGALRQVWVTTRSIDIGRKLSMNDVEQKKIPAALLPLGTVAKSVTGQIAVVPMLGGEPVMVQKLASGSDGGISALIPHDMEALAVPKTPATPILHRGETVSVVTGNDPNSPDMHREKGGALVVDVADESITIAVPKDQLDDIASAVTHGAVTLAVRALGSA